MSGTLNSNINQYVDIMSKRAAGELPEMGSAKRFAEIIRTRCVDGDSSVDILDIGCATGHYLRSILSQGISTNKYTGVDIDPCMLDEARRIWSLSSIKSVETLFVNADVQDLASSKISTHDITICSNAFMYFKSPLRALSNMIQLTSRFLLIRSYFMDVSYRIIRSQTSEIHDKSSITEAASITPDGDFISFDFWSIYSYAYIESAVKSISPNAKIEWLDDINDFSSIELENNIGLSKRSATTIEGNQELVYPFYLPWKYLLVAL